MVMEVGGAGGREPEEGEDFRPELDGTIDLHVHTGPDIFPRRVTAMEAAVAARSVGMAALLIKSHSTDTSARAEMVRDATGFPVFGGVVLNYPVGGLNPHAVVETGRQGGRCVWMPTIAARNFVAHGDMAPMLQAAIPRGVRGLVATQGGRLLPSVHRILDAVAEHDLMLTSGHLTADEVILMFEEAVSRGIHRLAVNHVEWELMGLARADIRALTGLGAFMEITKVGAIERRAALIREIGVEHCFLATDGGPVGDPAPVDILHQSIVGLQRLGFSKEELRYMSAEVPAYLLRLEGAGDRPKPPARRAE